MYSSIINRDNIYLLMDEPFSAVDYERAGGQSSIRMWNSVY